MNNWKDKIQQIKDVENSTRELMLQQNKTALQLLEKIYSAGYTVIVSECGMYFDLYCDDVLIFKDKLIIDLQFVVDMIENENDYSLELHKINSMYMPMRDAHFYNYLKSQGKDTFHRINDVNDYLEHCFSFERGINIIEGDCIKCLKYIGEHYFEIECKPLLSRGEL